MNYIEKVEEIFGWDYVKTFEKTSPEHYKQVKEMIEQVTTLLKESNKEAIEDMRIWCLTMKKAGGDLEHWVRVYGKTDKEIEEYLKTLDGNAKPNDTTDKEKSEEFRVPSYGDKDYEEY